MTSTQEAVTSAQSAAPVARRHHAVFHRLRVAAVEAITDDSVAITFDVPDELADEYRFAAGQHVTVRLPDESPDVRRNYSICSSAVSGRLRIGVKRLEDGRFSTWATTALRPGDVLEVMTPTGRFTTAFDPARRRHYVAFAAGSGITPVLSLISTALQIEPASVCTLVYGNRTTASMMFLEELQDLKDAYPSRLKLVHIFSREAQEVELLNGRLDSDRMARLLATLVPPETVDEWFLCGPYHMVVDGRALLLAEGVEPSRVHLELFHPEAPPRAAINDEIAEDEVAGQGEEGDAGASDVTILLDGRATTFALRPRAQSILDAALATRSDAPYACKGGICGTCRARLVEGEVDMDGNFALEDDELEAGFVLACQSHPRSPRVVLDFDG